MVRSSTLSIRARGPWALFTRPELKTERVSYPCITPSAARGLFEAIFWKPIFNWNIERIHILSPINYVSILRNEVKPKGKLPNIDKKIVTCKPIMVNKDSVRMQRNSVVLRNVDYIIDAFMVFEASRLRADENPVKYETMFKRRVSSGQCHHTPCLGCREFAANISPAHGAPPPIQETQNLGKMLWDIDYKSEPKRSILFDAKIVNGVIDVPVVIQSERIPEVLNRDITSAT